MECLSIAGSPPPPPPLPPPLVPPGLNSPVLIYTRSWVERGTVRVKCVAQEHYTMSTARTRIGSGGRQTNHITHCASPNIPVVNYANIVIAWNYTPENKQRRSLLLINRNATFHDTHRDFASIMEWKQFINHLLSGVFPFVAMAVSTSRLRVRFHERKKTLKSSGCNISKWQRRQYIA